MAIVRNLGIALLALAAQGASAQSLGPIPVMPPRPATQSSQAPQAASDAAAVFEGIDTTHQHLRASTARSLARGEACAALMRAGKLPKTTMAQYRCIVAGDGLAPSGAAAIKR